jgi:hypothetical protein
MDIHGDVQDIAGELGRIGEGYAFCRLIAVLCVRVCK